MAVAVNVAVFGDVMPCSLANIHRRFRPVYCPPIKWNKTSVYRKDKRRYVRYVSQYMISYW